MSSSTEQIKERLSIVDVVTSYIKLEKAGKNFKGRCPFHNEKTPSFFVSPERDSYYCFGCGAKGDIFTFVEHFEGVDFVGALKLLSERAGVQLDTKTFDDTNPNKRLLAACEEACQFFESALTQAADAKKYLADRKIEERTITTFRIGYAPDGWRHLHDYLLKKGFSLDEMRRAGLVKQKDTEGASTEHGHYDVFRARVMFPIFDASGRVAAFSGRILISNDNAPKYINSPETPLFKKSETLYGLDRAKGSMRKYDFAILVEGPIDLIMSHQAGFTNTVAVMGTAFTPQHVEKLMRFTNNLLIALDADDAGIASMKKTARMSLRAGMDVKIATLPEGSDPADTISKDLDAWKTAIREASHVIDFLLARTKNLHGDDDRKFKQKVRSDVLPYASLIGNRIDQAHFIGTIARVLGVDESLVLEELAKVAFTEEENREQITDTRGAQAEQTQGPTHIVRELAGILAWQEKAETKSFDVPHITKEIVEMLGKHPTEFFTPEEVGVLAFEAEATFEDSDILSRHINEMLSRLKSDMLKIRFAEAMQALAVAERSGDAEKAKEILVECTKLSKELEGLRS
ncbi:MAG: DNA primase [Patescibacteria group bacterium]